MNAKSLTFVALFTFFSSSCSAFSQEVTKCDAMLEGKISEAKIDKVITQLEKLPARFPGEVAVLCLNSPGGNVFHAMRLVNFFRGEADVANGIMTYVPKEAACNSSCAFILLSGFVCAKYTCYNARSAHRLAKVGFHTPSLPGVPISADIKDLQTAYSSGVDVVRQLFKSISNSLYFDRPGQRFSSEMLVDVLSTPPDEFYFLDKVSDFTKFKIFPVGEFQQEKLSIVNFINACNNSWAWISERSDGSSKKPMWTDYRFYTYSGLGGREAVITLDTHYADRLWATCRLPIQSEANVGEYFALDLGSDYHISSDGFSVSNLSIEDRNRYTELSEKEFLEYFEGNVNESNYWIFVDGEHQI